MTAILKALQGHSHSCPPIWLMRQAGRYLPEYRDVRQKVLTFMDLCFNEDSATEVTLQPLRRFDLDAAILFSDILVIPHVLGQTVHVQEKKGPVLDPIEVSSFFERARDIDLQEALSVPLKILQNVRKSLAPTKTLIGFVGSPWTIATYMLEGGKTTTFDRITHLLRTGDPLFNQTMALLEKSIGTFLVAQIQAGADVVQIFDTWAKAVPPTFQQEWIVSPIRRLIARIRKEHPNTPIIYYGRGVSQLYRDIVNGFTNVALGVDENVPISVKKDQLQPLAPVQGNLCPQILVAGGMEMKSKVAELLGAFQGTPYVFNLGHGIVPQTPVDHVSQLIDLVRENRSKQ